jgi:hypothetical protein
VPISERKSESRYLKRFLLFLLADAQNLQISKIGTDKRACVHENRQFNEKESGWQTFQRIVGEKSRLHSLAGKSPC